MATTKTPAKSAKTIILEGIAANKTDDQIIALVKKAHPESNADGKHMAKYRKMSFDGYGSGETEVAGSGDESRAAVGSKVHRDWAKANMAKATKASTCPHFKHWLEVKKADTAAAAAKKAAAKKAPAKKAA